MLEVISEFYNMNLANETRKGMIQNAKQGYHNGGTPPYGYRVGKLKDGNGKEKSVWVLGPEEEVNNIRRIFDLYVRQGKGYKVIINILNTEGVPSPTGTKWGFSTVTSILHNDAYIGRKVWNRYDYNIGKKKKPREEWIVVEDAHPPIIDIDTFNAVPKKSQERSPLGGAFKQTGPSLYILRGMLKCPMCGTNMVSGRNGKSSRNYSRYYLCGTYHRNGSTLCKRNTIPKDKIENAVINCLIKEFSLLSFPGSLDDEIRQYVSYKNRNITYQLTRIDDDIKHVARRIKLAKEEKSTPETSKYVAQYISELQKDVEKLTAERAEMSKLATSIEPTPNQIQMIRDRLKDFSVRIRIEPTDVQFSLLKQYIDAITFDDLSKNYKLNFHINLPGEDQTTPINILEKTIYFNLE